MIRIRHAFVLALAVLFAPACQGLGEKGVAGVVEQVGSLAGQVSDLAGTVQSGNITDALLSELGSLTDQSGGLAEQLGGFLTGAEAPEGLQPIQDLLGKLGGFDADEVEQLDQAGRKSAVENVGGLASRLQEMAKGFLAT